MRQTHRRLWRKALSCGLALALCLGMAGTVQAAKYTVKKGDSLWKIAQEELGAGKRWSEIYRANRDTIKNPNRIQIGQILTLPKEAEPAGPVATPSPEPSAAPVATPSPEPSAAPVATPSPEPSVAPVATPSPEPSAAPVATPSPEPSVAPSTTPSPEPSVAPSASPEPSSTVAPAESAPVPSGGSELTLSEAEAAIYVAGLEWGPAVTKIVVSLPKEVEKAVLDNASVTTLEAERTVTNIFLSDKEGNAVTSGTSKYVTLELKTTQTDNGSPFYNDQSVSQNKWLESYPVTAAFTVVVDGVETKVQVEQDCINNRICPEAEQFDKRGFYSGSYVNPMTEKEENLTLQFAAFEPEQLKNDKAKNPLVIWLHGQGEGGTDPDIVLIGNEVVALARPDIQKEFTTRDGESGAYVLAVQCPTYWMDGGDGTNSGGDVVSLYTEILMDTIKEYVSKNDDVDENRIYLGGCSNGGYMTMNMLVTYPDYWAAAYPVCEAYAFHMFQRDDEGNYAQEEGGPFGQQTIETDERWMTAEKIDAIKDIPIWFVHSANDPVVVPGRFSMPTYQALLQAGAENCWYSCYESIQGTDDPEAEYMGHFAWVPLFNGQITHVQDQDAIKNAKDTEGFTPSNDGGGTKTASDINGTYENIFQWLNAQVKR